MIKRALVAIAVVSLFSPVCNANTIVFDNLGGAPTTNAALSDLAGFIPTGEIDDVTLATTTVVTGINWSGVYDGGDGIVLPADDNFEIRIYADNAGAPGVLLETFDVGDAVNRTVGIDRALPLAMMPDREVQGFEYSADINFTFNAGITHWLSILNNTSGDSDLFRQSIVTTGGNAFGFLSGESDIFRPQAFATDFQLTTSAIPEPSSVGILALGLMGLLTRRKRS